jgi:hypothetical protein
MSKHLAWSTSRPWPFNAPTPRRFSQSSGAKLLASLMVAMLLVSNLFSLVLVQAASPDGPVWAWGKNDFGQVGDGTNTNSNIPVLTSLPAGVTAKAIATGGFHSQAIGSDNRLYAWGNNQAGELGNGTNTDTNRPVVVALPAGVTAKAIAAGGFHSLAIGSDNQLYAWGFNLYGQLGNGTNTDSNTPVLTLLPAGVIPKVIAAGNIHNLTIGNDNQLYAWGVTSMENWAWAMGVTLISLFQSQPRYRPGLFLPPSLPAPSTVWRYWHLSNRIRPLPSTCLTSTTIPTPLAPTPSAWEPTLLRVCRSASAPAVPVP